MLNTQNFSTAVINTRKYIDFSEGDAKPAILECKAYYSKWTRNDI
jgi:hypothetical protein